MPTTVGTVWVDVKFNIGDVAAQLQRQLGTAAGGAGGVGAGIGADIERTMAQRMAAIGQTMQSAGRQMTMALTVPLALIGKASINAFREFDQNMTRINALVGIPMETTEKWRTQVRNLGKEYGVAAEEAADALYFITSSGIEGGRALDVLETAVKGSAVGLGETKVVADVLTSALNAYQKTSLTAAQAADQLTVAVKRGKGEADEMAGALSQVIPIAANLGVSFGEVAGAMSAMTLSGTSADQAATQLRGLFNTLQDMPPIAQRALEQYTGLNYQNMRLKLTTEGLIPTLKTIFDAFGENKAALAEVFGNIRAMTGAMNLFGQNSETTLDILHEVTNASGDLNEAWEITAKSKAKQLDVAMNTLHDSLIGVGEELVPMVTKMASAFGALASTFSNMPGPVKAVAVGLGGILTVAGPLLVIAGSLTRAVSSLATAMENSGRLAEGSRANIAGMARTAGVAAGAVAAAATAWTLYANAMAAAEQAGRDSQEHLNALSLTGGLDTANKEIAQIDSSIAGMRKEIDDFSHVTPVDFASILVMPWKAAQKAVDVDYFFKQLPEQIAGGERAKKAIQDRIKVAQDLANQTGRSVDSTYRWLASEEKAGRVHGSAAAAYKSFIELLLKGDDAATQLAESNVVVAGSIEDIANKARAAGDMFFGVRDAELAVEDAQQRLADAGQKVLDAHDALAAAQQRTVEADRKIVQAQNKVTEAVQKTADARRRLAEAQQALNDALAGPSEEERIDVASARLALREAQKAARGGGDPLERQRAQLNVRRARLDLQRAEGAHDKRILDARADVADAEKAVSDAVQAEVDAHQGVIDARNAKAEASRNEARARDEIAAAERGVRDAERELFDATSNMIQKQGEFNTALMSGTINANWLLEYLTKVKEMYPQLGTEIDKYMDKVRASMGEAANRSPTPPAPVAPPAPAPTPEQSRSFRERLLNRNTEMEWQSGVGLVPKRRASGGPLSAGQLSTVNERDMPELWSANGKQYLLPVTPGQVVPLRPVDLGVETKGGDGVTVGDIYVQGATSPVETAYEVRRQLRVKTRTKGRA